LKHPNILFALADDASHFGLFGHSFVKTPVIDWVGASGIRFDNAFTSNPKCAPSRASILTGRYPWQNREACNHYCIFPKGLTLLPDMLEAGGYEIGYTGKGWAPGDYRKSGLTRNPAGIAYNNCTLTPPEGSNISNCDYAGNFKEFLDKKDVDKPFYFWYGCKEPHRAYTYGEGMRGGKQIEEVTEIPSYWPDCEHVRMDVLDYAYEIEWFDAHLGRMIEELRCRGELENTLIVVTSDNGCPFPRVKGQMYEQDFHLPMVACWLNQTGGGRNVTDLINFVDLMPTFLEAAQISVPETGWGKSFLSVFVSSDSGKILPGREYTYFGREKHDLGRENDLGYPVRCIRTEEYLYIYNFAPDRWPAGNPETGFTNCDTSPTKDKILQLNKQGESYYFNLAFGKRPQEELYYIVADPECLKNLAEEPECAPLKKDLKKRLFDMLIQTEDPRLEDPDYFDRFEYTGDDRHSWKAWTEGRFQKQPF